ncbi:hypothetical protein LCGC14_0337510 [marine sediment metagenome]|uniref:Uncharacterized protein n=1 Tax=marine sediment metagenome TaxID=412755 RepID=A0A0F9TKD2_9ZZZZ
MRQVDISNNVFDIQAYIDIQDSGPNRIFSHNNKSAIVELSVKIGSEETERHITADAYMENNTIHATISPITARGLNPDLVALLDDTKELNMKKKAKYNFTNITYLCFE